MDLARDLLDKEVVDRNGQAMGRADSVILDVCDGRPPRIVAIEIGPSALGDRLHCRVGRWIRAAEKWLGLSGRPVRISMEAVTMVDGKLRAHVAAGDTGVLELEGRLRALLRRLRWS